MQDYYSKYIDFENEIKEACDCINSNKSENLEEELEGIKSTIANLRISDENWPDSVGEGVELIISNCINGLDDIISSVSSTFRESESIYLRIQEELEELKRLNDEYQKRYSEKPNRESFRTIPEKNDEGKIIGYKVNEAGYSRAMTMWRGDVKTLGLKCEDLSTLIEADKVKLQAINAEKIKIKNASSLSSIQGNISNYFTLSASDYVLANGISISDYSKWGEDFYALAMISRADKQTADKCLGYANSYAMSVLDRNQTAYRNSPIMYSSKDKQEILKIMASEILAKRPVVIEVTGKHKDGKVDINVINNGVETSTESDVWSRHYAMAYGIRKGADLNNLQESDFLYLDPAGGEVKQLGTTNGGSQQRNLLHAQAATSHKENEYYCVNVFSDVDYSETQENTECISKGMTQDISGKHSVHYV